MREWLQTPGNLSAETMHVTPVTIYLQSENKEFEFYCPDAVKSRFRSMNHETKYFQPLRVFF